ncbi:U6 snRNA phosphodiesterase 1-like [Hydractinia symbiolongicarpus]|uniref:U6 snRNA phosphodiesterase 1-like n=1 Tax=Hydractinia symbiolongicarpus TaxID=13093 RepID=UPI00254C1C08|nr:U6 snRNA phosphodiesterase 1-like [Hydractinia symbiolongicarpus]
MSKLVSYSDSGSEDSGSATESDDTIKPCNRSRKRKQDSKYGGNKQKLPLPPNLFEKEVNLTDNKQKLIKHNGRIRSFDHFEGNWATYIYIPLQSTTSFTNFYESIAEVLTAGYKKDIHLFPISDCHISCSRTVSLRHYWIEPIFKELQQKFLNKMSYTYGLQKIQVYVNDEKTRTFIGVEVIQGVQDFKNITTKVDSIYSDYKLEKYYDPPSFHTSIAWVLGDKKDEIENYLHNQTFAEEIHYMSAEKICMRSGNRTYQVCFV